MKMNKKWLWIGLSAVAAAAVVGTGIFFSQRNKEPVYVFGFDDGVAGMADYYDGNNESGGMVTTDRIQPVFLSETQKVLEVFVEEGQKVRKGDILFTYDTTLSDLTLRQKELSVQQAKLDLETARQELAVINSYVPISYHPVAPTEPTEPEEPVKDLKDFDLTGKDYLAYSGSGKTALTPKYCWLRSGVMVDENMMSSLFSDAEGDVLFVRFRSTQGDANDGALKEEYGIKMMRLSVPQADGTQNYTYRYGFFDPNRVVDSGPVDDGIDWNSGFTAAQIASMRADKKAEIKEKEFGIKVAEAEFSIMQKEADSGEVTAQFDGTVIAMQDPEMSAQQKQPFFKVSGGGGFYVTGSISELDLSNVQLGQKVMVTSWDTMQSYEGSVVEISEFPQESEGYYYGGNRNVSYYPYKIFIEESAALQDGYYVSLSLQAGENQGKLYVQDAFLRQNGPENYVYVRSEDGTLCKRSVQVGGKLWGSYTEIRSGLTTEDWLAFPYGKTVQEGAPTQEGTWENLANS